ncbi:MAG: site-2 protease family protein [Planctomycetaceae bacterium]|nr:site-2 protease family protein [Planctomycetales bacterium]MCB9923474.1 site-2 protease family protein [Planctomycetaceae bacterium]
MHGQTSWTLSLGRWGGVSVRLHVFFVLFGTFTLFLGWRDHDLLEERSWIAPTGLILLFLSVLIHELGHYIAALRLGGDGDEIVIGPGIGLAPMQPPLEPQAECLMHLAGPIVNSAIFMITGGIVWAISTEQFTGLLNPLEPQQLVEGGAWLVTVKLMCWINWVMVLANLLPAFPFDGGRALRAWLSARWPDASPRRAASVVTMVAKLAAGGLIITAWLVRDHPTNQAIPLWFSLVILAIFLYFGAKQEDERPTDSEIEDELFGYDFSQGYTSLERSTERRHDQPGPFARWLEQRREAKRQRQIEIEIDEERRADELLGRLHEKGMESLSDEERLLLKRVSARYRQRNGNQG